MFAGSLVYSCPPAPIDALRDTRRGVICSCSRTDQVVLEAAAQLEAKARARLTGSQGHLEE